jgi:hypothetical protein
MSCPGVKSNVNAPCATTNIEDTLALPDADLQSAFATQFPEAWGRIQRRRAFMTDTLGINLPGEMLPFGNIPAFLPPFLLNPHQAAWPPSETPRSVTPRSHDYRAHG